MKKIALIFILTIACQWSFAQGRGYGVSPQMQNLQQAKVRAMIDYLEISEAQRGKFKAIYIAYDNAVNQSAARLVKSIGPLNKLDKENITREQVNQSIKAQLALSQELIDIKGEYLEKFNAVLTPAQMLGFYQKENMIRSRIQKEHRNRSQRGGSR